MCIRDRRQLERGQRLVELLKQTENNPQSTEYQMTSIYLAGEGVFDDVPVQDVRRFESELMEHLYSKNEAVFEQIDGGKPFSDESKAELKSSVDEFKKGFQTSDGEPVAKEAPAEPLAEGEKSKQQISVSRKTAK